MSLISTYVDVWSIYRLVKINTHCIGDGVGSYWPYCTAFGVASAALTLVCGGGMCCDIMCGL